MGMGISQDKLRNAFLGLMVILSFILSYYLWTVGRNIGEEEAVSGTTFSNISLTTHTVSETFRPSSIALHGTSEPGSIRIGPTYPLIDRFEERSEMQNLNEIEETVIVSNANYFYTLQNGEWIEFIYDEPIPLGVLSPKFDALSQELANQFIDRIVIDSDNRDIIYFYNMETETIYNVSTLNSNEIELDAFFDTETIDYHPAQPVFLENSIIYLPNAPVNVPYRSYVIDQLSDPVYVSNFFPDTSQVEVRTTGNITRYIDLTKEVSINRNTHTLMFLRQIADSGQLSPTSRFLRSFEQIERFENWSDTLALSSYNEETGVVSFRREVDGIPVFDKQEHETISEVNLVESGVTHLKIPTRFISTPISIPGNEDESLTEELISGTEVIQLINSTVTTEEFDTIENIKIGYTWHESDEDNQVVNFQPDWYVLQNGNWQTLEDFLELHRGEAYGL
jgi:regulatory protein YycH of two-component signal transduction system YycFG